MQVELEGDFLVEPDCILGRREITLWNHTIGQMKVQWKHLSPEEATWELESYMRAAYPILFQGNFEDDVIFKGVCMSHTPNCKNILCFRRHYVLILL